MIDNWISEAKGLFTMKVYRFVPIFLTVASTFAVLMLELIFVTIPMDSSFHFGLMTVNALIGGFLYSNYGLLVGLLDNETIQAVNATSIMSRRNTHILCGITYATLSVLCGLYIVLLGDRTGLFPEIFCCCMINGEIVFMISSISFFLCSIKEMNELVRALNNPVNQLGKKKVEKICRNVMYEGQG